MPNELLVLGRVSLRRARPSFAKTTPAKVWSGNNTVTKMCVSFRLHLPQVLPVRPNCGKEYALRMEGGDAANDIGQIPRPWRARGRRRSLHASETAAACCRSGNAAVAAGTGIHLPFIGAVRMPWSGLACCTDVGQYARRYDRLEQLAVDGACHRQPQPTKPNIPDDCGGSWRPASNRRYQWDSANGRLSRCQHQRSERELPRYQGWLVGAAASRSVIASASSDSTLSYGRATSARPSATTARLAGSAEL